ncbi:hypothetical protein CPC08DRAFT_713687 [Agrocybe pediades]|nr:hypothetical protein CPC08DRAFT_713687 [Agrocybe pediades]
MPQASQLSAIRLSEDNPSRRVRTAYHGNVEASACPGGIDCALEDEVSQVVSSQAPGQAPDVNSREPEGSIANFLVFSLICICTKAMQIVSAGLFPASNWCYYLFHCAPDEGVADQSRREYLDRWEAALISIACSWKDTQSISTSLLVASAFAILQLDDALNNRAICTCISAAILLAVASILSSFIYLLSKERFISRWKTSETPCASFWRCIGMPLDFAIWSFIFFLCTVFILIYTRMLPALQAYAPTDQPTINTPETSGAIFVTVLFLLSICKIYYGLFFLLRSGRRSTAD